MDLTIVDLDEAEHLEQAFLVLTESREVLGGFGVGFGIVIVEHLARTRGPGIAPGLHQTAQLARRAVVRLGNLAFVQLLGQHHGRAGRELRAHRVDFFQADSHAAARGHQTEALAVNPDAVPGLAAQPVHRIGIVEGIGDASVFLEVQAAGDFVFHKIDALGRAQVVELLLVARQLARDAGKGIFEFERTFFLEKKEGTAIFVHRHQMRGQAFIIEVGLPVVGAGRSGRYNGERQGQRQSRQQPGHGRAKRRRSSDAAGKPGSGLSGPDPPAPCV